MSNFKDIACIIPTAGVDRWLSAYAAAASVLLNTKNNTVFLCYNGPFIPSELRSSIEDLKGLATCTSNNLIVNCYPAIDSKSTMMMKVVDSFSEYGVNPKYLMNIDDDFLIPGNTFKMISSALNTFYEAVYIYGLVDVLNKRKHVDYDITPKEVNQDSIHALADEWGDKVLPHRVYNLDKQYNTGIYRLEPGCFLMHSEEDFKRNHGAGSWIVPVGKLLEHTALCDSLRNWDKRVKGEDVTLVKALGEQVTVRWIVGSNSFHTDFNGTEINDTWNLHLPFDAKELDL